MKDKTAADRPFPRVRRPSSHRGVTSEEVWRNLLVFFRKNSSQKSPVHWSITYE